MAKISDKRPALMGVPIEGITYLDILDGAGSVDRPIEVEWHLTINGRHIPKIAVGPLFEALALASPSALSDDSRHKLFEVIDGYYVNRWKVVSSIQSAKLREKLHRINEACAQFQEAIEIGGHIDVLAWDRLENVEPETLKRDDVYPFISLIRNRSHRAYEEFSRAAAANHAEIDPIEIWDEFVAGLAGVFHSNGWNVKISKSQGSEGVDTPHPSHFVNFAWEIISRLPKDVQEHASSRWALADALSKSRARQK